MKERDMRDMIEAKTAMSLKVEMCADMPKKYLSLRLDDLAQAGLEHLTHIFNYHRL